MKKRNTASILKELNDLHSFSLDLNDDFKLVGRFTLNKHIRYEKIYFVLKLIYRGFREEKISEIIACCPNNSLYEYQNDNKFIIEHIQKIKLDLLPLVLYLNRMKKLADE